MVLSHPLLIHLHALIRLQKVNIKINCRPGEALGFHVAGGDKVCWKDINSSFFC
jgi:hypothetical protein